ncbi:conserved hypothetical protein [Desulfonatronum zhilinae]|nr:conserved hypothetical protein [Desulfonatronum zhilinae]
MPRLLAHAFKLGIIVACFGLIYFAVDFDDFWAKLTIASPILVAAAFGCVLVEPLLMAHRTRLLLQQKGIFIGFFQLTRLVFISNFLSVAVPSGAGPDAVRILMLKRSGHSGTHSTSTLLMDRMLSVLSLALLSFPGLILVWSHTTERALLWSVLGVMILVLILSVLAISRVPGLVLGWMIRRLCTSREDEQSFAQRLLHWGRTSLKLLASVHTSFREFSVKKAVLVRILFWNVVNQFLRVIQILLLFSAFGHSLPMATGLAFVPVILLVVLLPITYYGLGVKEGAFLFFFVQVGVPASTCLAVSVLTYALVFGAMIPGAVFLLWRENVTKEAEIG